MSLRIVIPARQGSKGLPGKNRKLFDDTAKTIPVLNRNLVCVTTDDPEIMKMAKAKKFDVFERSPELSNDKASMKDVLINLANYKQFSPDDIIIMLYLTYPKRKWTEIMDAFKAFNKANAGSLLCRLPWKGTHPALCMRQIGLNYGQQLFNHNLYRRQDYPDVFEISHYICIIKVRELHRVNFNLYNDNTLFFPIGHNVVDVNTEEDFKKVSKKSTTKETTEKKKRIFGSKK